MKKKICWKGIVHVMVPFVFVSFLFAPFFQSCQEEEMIEPEEVTMKSVVEPEIYLTYPEIDIVAGEDFDITFSSSCGKIMLERGFVEEYDEATLLVNKVFVGLTCETENLHWESVGEDVFETCYGETVTENIDAPGTYVYRAKLNMKAVKKSGCSECATLLGNQFECFMVTVAECNQDPNTFRDQRDGHIYKTITIGTQTWMAENLAYVMGGSYVYDNNEANIPFYGRLYNREAALNAAPAGWHLPSMAEWETLFTYLSENGYGVGGSGSDIAKALASELYWHDYFTLSGYPYPGSDPELNNSSGFNGLPAGFFNTSFNRFENLTYSTYWWSSDPGQSYPMIPNSIKLNHDKADVFKVYNSILNGLSIRCLKD